MKDWQVYPWIEGFAIGGIIATLLLIGLIHHDRRAVELNTVYAVCQQSRISPTIDERGCGDLQDQTNSEYLCDNNNMLVSNHCWVEGK